MKSTYKIASILTAVILVASPMLALAGGPGFSGGVDDGGNTCSVPLDGGLSMLVAAGIGYSARKLAKKKNKQSENA
jgi:hypothetical protein